MGQSEQTLGQSFKNLKIARQDVVIATKAYSRVGEGPNDTGASRGHIMDAIEGSLRRLQTDHIDLYQIHANDDVTPVEETLRTLDDLIRQGEFRYIGLSNWQAWKIARSLGLSQVHNLNRFQSVQAYYSIAGRALEREIAPLLQTERMGLLVWSPLAGGLLSGRFRGDNQKPEGSRRSEFDFPIVNKERVWNILDVLAPIAQAHNCSSTRIALAWLLTRALVTSIVLGAKRLDQLKDNIAAVNVHLTEDEIKKLDDVSNLPLEYPGWMLDVRAPIGWDCMESQSGTSSSASSVWQNSGRLNACPTLLRKLVIQHWWRRRFRLRFRRWRLLPRAARTEARQRNSTPAWPAERA
jgi:aryl-alcohol dehydrogenase-like predicted oxidoreductase